MCVLRFFTLTYLLTNRPSFFAQIFARIGKQITIAAKAGGPSLESNKALADAVELAKAASFPKDTMDKAIARATNKDQADFKASSFEAYGHGGCGIYIDVLTDNLNRAAADIRTLVNKQGLKIASPGSVAFNFDRKGVVRVAKEGVDDFDDLLTAAMEGDAEECEEDPEDAEQFRITAPMEGLQRARDAVKAAGYSVELAQLEMIPKTTMDVSDGEAEKNEKAMELIEDLDDVDAVASNMSYV